jgi:putative endonuclease
VSLATAASFLKRQGYHIVAQHLDQRLVELDLVAIDGRTMVFVKIKTRSSAKAGHLADAVDDRKQ